MKSTKPNDKQCNSKRTKPIYLQIAERISDEILLGHYATGARIPSVREYAALVEVNANTVMRSYEFLQTQGIIFTSGVSDSLSRPDAKIKIREYRRNGVPQKRTARFFMQLYTLHIPMDEIGLHVSGIYRKPHVKLLKPSLMKRSTIALLIVLAVMIFAPIITIKIISNLSPETKMKGSERVAERKGLPMPPLATSLSTIPTTTRYIPASTSRPGPPKIPGRESSLPTARTTRATPCTSPTNGQRESSTDSADSSIPQSWFRNQTLDYDHNTRLIIENHNPNVTLYFSEGNFDRVVIQSSG